MQGRDKLKIHTATNQCKMLIKNIVDNNRKLDIDALEINRLPRLPLHRGF